MTPLKKTLLLLNSVLAIVSFVNIGIDIYISYIPRNNFFVVSTATTSLRSAAASNVRLNEDGKNHDNEMLLSYFSLLPRRKLSSKNLTFEAINSLAYKSILPDGHNATEQDKRHLTIARRGLNASMLQRWRYETFNETDDKYVSILKDEFKVNKLLEKESLESAKRSHEAIPAKITTNTELIDKFNVKPLDESHPEVVDLLLSKFKNELPIKLRSRRVIFFVMSTNKSETQIMRALQISYALQVASLKVPVYWIVVEKSSHCSRRIRDILVRSSLPFAHTFLDTKEEYRVRNEALKIIYSLEINGVVHFGEESSRYDSMLFPELSFVKRAGIFAVGYTPDGPYRRCKTDSSGRVIGVYGNSNKPHAESSTEILRNIGLNGLAFSTAMLRTKSAMFTKQNNFVGSVLESPRDLEALAANCTQILTWNAHTYTRGSPRPFPRKRPDRMLDFILKEM